MKRTHDSIFISILFMYILAVVVVAADDWFISMLCGDKVEFVVQHRNHLGTQTISWNLPPTSSFITVCSKDQVICVKNMEILTPDCNKVSVNFKVQYGSVWSRYNYADFTGIRDLGNGYKTGDPFFFDPIFI
ncbi:hypothetical protein BD560DRAFT_494367 [Blakeslea trispora]|nr:hypothetical protein BD560DRAFT_494367 [Blakeslea trispora]